MATDRTRNQSDILNGGQSIEVIESGMIGLSIKEPALGDDEILLQFERNVGGSPTTFVPVEIIQSSMDFYVETTGDDTNNGSVATPWATPHKAMDWLHRRSIVGEDTRVTVHIGEGNFYFEEAIISQHSDGHKIYFEGEGLYNAGTRPAGFQIGDWSTLSETPQENWPIVPTKEPNHFQNTAGLMPAYTLIDDSENVLGRERKTRIEADRAANETLIKERYKTRLIFMSGSAGFVAMGGSIGGISKLAILADEYLEPDWDTNKRCAGVEASGYERKDEDGNGIGTASSTIMLEEVAIHGFGGYGVLATGHSNIYCKSSAEGVLDGITVTGSGSGIISTRNSSIVARHATLQGNMRDQVYALYDSHIDMPDSVVSGGARHGILADRASSISSERCSSTGNTYTGFYSHSASSVYCADSFSNGNGHNGFVSQFASSMFADGCQAVGNNGSGFGSYSSSHMRANTYTEHNKGRSANNAGNGVSAGSGSSMEIRNMHVVSNRVYGIVASQGSFIDFTNSGSYYTYQRSSALDNGYYQDGYDRPQIAAYWNSTIQCMGALIRRRAGVIDTDAVRAAHSSSLYLSSSDETYYNTTILANTSGGRPLVYSYKLSHMYDSDSNLSHSPNTSSYYSPLGNVLSSDGAYNQVYKS